MSVGTLPNRRVRPEICERRAMDHRKPIGACDSGFEEITSSLKRLSAKRQHAFALDARRRTFGTSAIAAHARWRPKYRARRHLLAPCASSDLRLAVVGARAAPISRMRKDRLNPDPAARIRMICGPRAGLWGMWRRNRRPARARRAHARNCCFNHKIFCRRADPGPVFSHCFHCLSHIRR